MEIQVDRDIWHKGKVVERKGIARPPQIEGYVE